MNGLIGRDDEMAAVTLALKRSDLAGIVLLGEPGVGKTALLDEGLRLAGGAGFATVRVTGERALSDLPLAALAPLLPRRPTGDAGDLVELREALRSTASGRPIILGVDDAHLLDDASAAVVHQLAADLSVFVIGTVRSGETPPDAVTSLWKERLVSRLEVGPLPRAALEPLAESVLGGDSIDPDLADEIWRRSAGNPLFVRELLLGARDAGTVTHADGRWSLTGTLSAPGTVAELLGSRLAGLHDDELRAVRLVALGGSLDIDLLESLVDPDTVVGLETARLLTADENGTTLDVRFAHPLHADAVRHHTGRLVARQLRRELADALEAAGGGATDDVLRIVTLRLESGGHTSAPLLARAARIALRRNDATLAERLAATSVAETRSLSSASVLANALVEQGRHADALVALADDRLDRASATADDRARADLLRASIEFWGLGHAENALDLLTTGRQAAPPSWLDRFTAVEISIEASRPRPSVALGLIESNTVGLDDPLVVGALLLALTAAGRPGEALERVPLPPDEADHRWAVASAAYAFALAAAGRVAEAGAMAIDRWESAVRSSSPHARVAWCSVLGTTESMQGRMVSAARWFDEAAHLAPITSASLHGRRWALGGALFCAVQVGDRARAIELCAQLDALPPHDAEIHAHLGHRGRAWLPTLDGDVDGAAAELVRLAREAREGGRHLHEIEFLADIARLGRGSLAAAELSGDDRAVDGEMLPVLMGSMRAFARGDVDEMGRAADRFHELGLAVLAAETAGGAAVLAEQQRHDPRAVAAAKRRAQQLRAAVSDVATPALTMTPVDLPLSRREREIAVLVARGRTSREVAEELVIGVRTVESHLTRIFDKLGVRSRGELPAALGITDPFDAATTTAVAAGTDGDMVGAT